MATPLPPLLLSKEKRNPSPLGASSSSIPAFDGTRSMKVSASNISLRAEDSQQQRRQSASGALNVTSSPEGHRSTLQQVKDSAKSGRRSSGNLLVMSSKVAPTPSENGSVMSSGWERPGASEDPLVKPDAAVFEVDPKRKLTRQANIPRGTRVIRKVDAFATKIVESTIAGGAITLLVWLATSVYVAMVVYQWLTSPPIKTVGTEWTIGFGPSPMRLACMATSGCLLSNTMTATNSLGISNLISPSQRVCLRMGFNTTVIADVAFSVDPTEGLSVLWDPTTASYTSLVGGGILIYSEIRCSALGDNDPACVFQLPTPIAAGTALLQYVETTNSSASGAARHRREWFANMISSDSKVLPASTPCYNTANPDPALAGWVQARLRMNSFYNTVDVSKDSVWLVLFGTAGGAYSLFLQVGALLLATFGFTAAMHQKWKNKEGVDPDLEEGDEGRRGAEDDDLYAPSQRGRDDLDSARANPGAAVACRGR